MTPHAPRAARRRRSGRRRPVVLAAITWAYVIWSLVPVLVAIQFSFNAGKSRSSWQGFSLRWYAGDPNSVAADPSLRLALVNSLVLAALTTLVATPLGVALALGLSRWRGRTSRVSNGLMLLPLATPEIVMGSALYLVFTNLYLFIPLGRPAQLLGHVTFSISYVVVIVRSRLASIGEEYETAARDLGADRLTALRLVVLPLLLPAIFASAMIVVASSMDDFVISSFLSPDASSVTVPIKLYSAVRNSPSPALNALATLLLAGSALALFLAWLVLRRRGASDALKEMATM
ncbi:ABC transporter permease [Sphaerisporangium corydalis]|uniref:ABC transporter permease n=1 Tax=Sphaerisporangium corydalis TaxID=1441875 RepID=A0ABV9EA55_9ACTN|nr:ABC transporter permease [Sphaerisporangium corydalis]